MASSTNINQNNNVVTLQDNNGSLSITNNNTGTTVNVTQPVTNIVSVAAIGPQGPVGPIPSSGAFTGSFSGSFTGSLQGTASYALTASYLQGYVSPFPYSGSAVITGSLTVSGSSTFTNIGPAIFSGSVIGTDGFSGSFSGSGANLFDIPASGITGLNLSRIATGSVSASVSPGTASFAIVSGSSTFMFVSSSGNVGLGTTTPAYTADINGSTRIVNDLYLGTTSTTGANIIVNRSSVGSADLLAKFDFRRNSISLGYIEVGTNSSLLEYAFYANGQDHFRLTTSTALFGKSNGTSNIQVGIWATSNHLTLGAQTSAAANIDTIFQGGYGEIAKIRAIKGANLTPSGQLAFYTHNGTASSETMRIFSTGNIGINTTTDAGFKLDVNGNSRVKGAGATDSTNAFVVQNSAGSSALTIANGLTTIVHGDLQLVNTVLYWASASQIRNISNGVLRITNSSNSDFTRLQFGGGTTAFPSLQRNGSALAIMDATGTSLSNLLIGTTTDIASSKLTIESTTQGFLPPRTNLTSNIPTPAQGLITYVTSSATEGLYYYNSGSNIGWHRVLTNSGSQDISGSLNVTSFTASNATISGNVTVLGTASIGTLVVNQIGYSSGSNQLGDAVDDTQTLYGTVRIPTGSLIVSGALAVSSSQNSYFVGGGNVGIGTTTPVNPGSGYTGLTINSVSAGGYLWFQNAGTTQYSIGAEGGNIYHNITSGAATYFRTGGSYWLTIAPSTGNILINTSTDAGYKLDINGSQRILGNLTITAGGSGTNTFNANVNYLFANQNNVYGLVDLQNAAGQSELFRATAGYSISSGTTSQFILSLRPTYNFTGTYAGIVRGLYYNPTLTSMTGVTHRAIETTSGNVIFNGGNVGIGTSTPSASLQISGSNPLLRLNGSGSELMSVDGASGRLFTVSDDLSNSLFSVNTIAGLPVIEAFATNDVFLGKYNTYPIKTVASGTLAVITGSISGSVAAPGLTTQIVYNNGGVLGADSGFVYSGSRVGIGTSTPTSTLDVAGLGRFTNGLTVTGSFRSFSTASSGFLSIVSGSQLSSDIAFNFRKIGETAGSRHTMIVEGTGGNDNNLYFGVNGVGSSLGATFAVKGNGSVNINMPSPTGNYGGLAVGGWITSYPSLLVRGVGATSATTALLVENSSAVPSLSVLDNGYVGIGTTTPQQSLEISGSGIRISGAGTKVFEFSDTSFAAVRAIFGSMSVRTSTGVYVGNNEQAPSARLHVSGASSETLLKIDSPASSSILFVSGSGRVNINTTASRFDLTLKNEGRIGSDFISDSFISLGNAIGLQANYNVYTLKNLAVGVGDVSARLGVRGSGTTSATTALLVQNSNASASLSVLDNGNVGVGTTTAAYRLSVLAPNAGDGIAAYVGGAAMVMTGNNGSGNPGISSTSGVIHISSTINGTGGAEVLNVNKSSNGAYIQAWRSFASVPLSLVDGNGNFAIRRTSATASLDVAGTTRISGSFNTAASGSILTVIGSGSAQPIFTVQGSQGELFSITDSLSGSLFSVNDISGLPILEVFSDNTTLIGNYQDPMLITTAKVVQTNSGSFTVYSLPTASYDTAFFEYSVKSGSNARAGTIMAIQLGSTVNFTETTTTDFGDTTPVSFTVIVTGSNMALTGSSTTGSWTIKTIVRGL